MARRDILARYRGSFGDVFWTVLNPLLLMATYFFVFGIVLQSRFGADQSRTGFALYFLAGHVALARVLRARGTRGDRDFGTSQFRQEAGFSAGHIAGESGGFRIGHRTFRRRRIHRRCCSSFATASPRPCCGSPCCLFRNCCSRSGICWFLAALGVYMRDLGQIMALVLTMWFFITPICYPESSTLSPAITAVMRQNPLYVLVRGYRAVFLEGHAPELLPLVKLWAIALVLFFLGHVWFYRLRKSFADVI